MAHTPGERPVKIAFQLAGAPRHFAAGRGQRRSQLGRGTPFPNLIAPRGRGNGMQPCGRTAGCFARRQGRAPLAPTPWPSPPPGARHKIVISSEPSTLQTFMSKNRSLWERNTGIFRNFFD